MSPKEKALQLVQRYINEACQDDEVVLYTSIAKKCALIAVDEIIESNPTELNEKFYLHPYTSEYMESSLAYWKEVKQEIELL